MGKGSDQIIGYKYFAGLQVVIGGVIEKLLDINPDKRGWLDDGDSTDGTKTVLKRNLFGGRNAEGGWIGLIDVHTGRPETLRQNEYLAIQDSPIVSSFPYLSYLVYRGGNIHTYFNPETLEVTVELDPDLDKGFELVSMSGMLKEVLYWVKRTQIRNDGTEQWYRSYSHDDGREIIVCEMQSWIDKPPEYPTQVEEYAGTPIGYIESRWVYTADCSLSDSEPATITTDKTWNHIQSTVPYNPVSLPFPKGQALDGPSGSGPSVGCSWISSMAAGRKYGRFRVTVTNGAVDGAVCYSFNIGVPELCEIGEHLKWTWFSDPNGAWFEYKRTSSTIVTFKIIVNHGSLLDIEFQTKSADHPTRPNTDYWYEYNYTFSALYVLQMAGKYRGGSPALGIDINPIHLIREIITDDIAMNKPESMINDENFKFAARRIWDEDLGVSWAVTEMSCKQAIDDLLYHIEAGIRVNRQTGKYEIVLFRDDLLDLDNALEFNESNIKSFNLEPADADLLRNRVNVDFYDRDNIKKSAFSLDEQGSVHTMGELESENLQFPYFMSRKNAEKVGNWKLKQLSTLTRAGTFTTGKYDARKINRYDVVKLSWANQQFADLPVRIMKIGLGDGVDNTVTLDWVEVIPYSSIIYSTINVDPPTSVVLPPQPNTSIAFEMPYYEVVQQFGQTLVDAELSDNPDLGYVMVATKRPQNNSINAYLYVDAVQKGVVNYAPTVMLDQNIGRLDASFAIKNATNLSMAEIGSLIYLGNEIMVFESFDAETSIITVGRGALDTVPHDHLNDDIAFFYDSFNGFSNNQYVIGEEIAAQVVTTTPSGVQDLETAPELPLEFDARAIRPYPPANVKINDEYYPIEIETDLVVTWVDRNRVQQTGGSILGWTNTGVTIEAGVTYVVELYDADDVLISSNDVGAVNTTTVDVSSVTTTSCKIKLFSIRDGYVSFQAFEHVLVFSFNAPYDLLGNWNEATQAIDLTWEFDE